MTMVETTNGNNGNTPMDRHASALANIQQLVDDLREAHEEIAQLKADLHREEDRCALLVADKDRIIEENKKDRSDAVLVRDKLVELATAMTNIGLLTIPAQEIMRTVQELTKK